MNFTAGVTKELFYSITAVNGMLMMWKIQRAKQDYTEFILRRIHPDPLLSRVTGQKSSYDKISQPAHRDGGRGVSDADVWVRIVSRAELLKAWLALTIG